MTHPKRALALAGQAATLAALVFSGLAVQASPSPSAPSTTGAGAAAKPSLSPSAPIAPKPSAPRAGGNAGNLGNQLLKAPSPSALVKPNTSQAATQATAATAAQADRLPPDPTFTAAGSKLGQLP